MGHENAEGMAHVGVRVEPTVRLGHGAEAEEVHSILGLIHLDGHRMSSERVLRMFHTEEHFQPLADRGNLVLLPPQRWAEC